MDVRRVSHRLAFEACRVGIAYASCAHSILGHCPDFFVFHFSKEMERKKDIPSNVRRNVRSRIPMGEPFALEPSHIHTSLTLAYQYLGVPHLRSIVVGPARTSAPQTSSSPVLTVDTGRIRCCNNPWVTISVASPNKAMQRTPSAPLKHAVRPGERMKTRESGMPSEEMWQTFFSPADTLQALGLRSDMDNVVDLGCGYGTVPIPAAQITSGTVCLVF